MQSLEDFIDWSTAAPPIPPTFNNSSVVAMHHEVLFLTVSICEVPDQAFKGNGLCPSDISLSIKCLPAWDEAPCPPLVSNGDHDSEFRACI